MMRNRSCLSLIVIAVLLTAGFMLLMVILAVVEVRDGLSPLEIAYLNLWLNGREADINSPIGSSDDVVTFVINPGDTASAIGQNLMAQNLITDPELFRNYVRFNGLDDDLEAGTYFLRQTQTLAEIAQALTDSSAASITVSILEGWRREEIAAAIDATPLLPFDGEAFLAVTGPDADIPADFAGYVGLPEAASLEGFLYPETYFLAPDTTALEFRDRLLNTFREQVNATTRASALESGRTLYEVVIIASIAEREAVHPEELELVTSVYLNRLAIGMKLDADPTVQYGIGFQNGSWWPSITQEDYVNAVSPYNTYLINGLPPGPIANPSLAAIQAAVFPAETTFYYFRATCANDGYHTFAETFEEHLANGNCS